MGVRSASRRLLAGGSALLAVLTTVVYVGLIQREGDDRFWEIFPWVMIMLIGTLLAVASALTSNLGVGRFAASAATVVLGLLGVVAIFSVGLGFIVAAVFALLAAVMRSEAKVQTS